MYNRDEWRRGWRRRSGTERGEGREREGGGERCEGREVKSQGRDGRGETECISNRRPTIVQHAVHFRRNDDSRRVQHLLIGYWRRRTM